MVTRSIASNLMPDGPSKPPGGVPWIGSVSIEKGLAVGISLALHAGLVAAFLARPVPAPDTTAEVRVTVSLASPPIIGTGPSAPLPASLQAAEDRIGPVTGAPDGLAAVPAQAARPLPALQPREALEARADIRPVQASPPLPDQLAAGDPSALTSAPQAAVETVVSSAPQAPPIAAASAPVMSSVTQLHQMLSPTAEPANAVTARISETRPGYPAPASAPIAPVLPRRDPTLLSAGEPADVATAQAVASQPGYPATASAPIAPVPPLNPTRLAAGKPTKAVTAQASDPRAVSIATAAASISSTLPQQAGTPSGQASPITASAAPPISESGHTASLAPEAVKAAAGQLNDIGPIEPKGGADTSERMQRMQEFIDRYDGGTCFFASARSISEVGATIDGFATEKDKFHALDATFKASTGIEADVVGQTIRSAQCPAVDFLRATRRNGLAAPMLDLDRRYPRRGEILSGTIRSTSDRPVSLFLVSETGVVDDLSESLNGNGATRTFGFPVRRDGAGAPYPQLLVAVSGELPLAKQAAGTVVTAQQFFAWLTKTDSQDRNDLSGQGELFVVQP